MDNNQYLKIINAYTLSFSKKDNNFLVHSHKFFELLCVIKGKCIIHLCDSRIELSEFQCIFIDSNIDHKLEIDESCTFSYLSFGYSTIKTNGIIDIKKLSSKYIPMTIFLSKKSSYIVFERAPNICHSVKDLLFEIQKEDSDAGYLVEVLFTRVLIEMARTLESNGTKSFSYLKRAKNYIRNNFSNPISVNLIAQQVGLSASYMQSIFKEHLKCGVMEYVNKLRLEQSTILLMHTNKCIVDIAIDVGFNSRQQFGRAFKNFYLISPQKYRIIYNNPSDILITQYEDFTKE